MKDIIYKNGNGRFSQTVRYGDLLFIAGQVGDTREADVAQQTRELLAKLDRIMAENGTDKEHMLWAIVYVRDVSDAPAMNAVWDAWVSPGREPARVCSEGKLTGPDWKVEITLVAAV